jgi:hypothetical protein
MHSASGQGNHENKNKKKGSIKQTSLFIQEGWKWQWQSAKNGQNLET